MGVTSGSRRPWRVTVRQARQQPTRTDGHGRAWHATAGENAQPGSAKDGEHVGHGLLRRGDDPP